MWISGYVTGNSFKGSGASLGEVQAAGTGKVSVRSTAEYRSIPVLAPYGIAYIAPVGERSLVLPTEDGSVCVGVVAPAAPDLQAGELMLYSAGGASIVLKNDGRVLINGREVTA